MRHKIAYSILILVALSLIGWMGDTSRLIKEGNAHYTAEDYDMALDAYQAATGQRHDALPYYNSGVVLYKKRQFDHAADAFRHALVANNVTLRAAGYYGLGNSLLQLGDMDGAIHAYKNALRLSPSDLEAKYNLELALIQLQQLRQKPGRQGKDITQQNNHQESMEVGPHQKQAALQPESNSSQSLPDNTSTAETMKVLESFSNDERGIRKKLLQKQFGKRQRPDKDW